MNRTERWTELRERVTVICTGLPEVTVDGDQHLRFAVRGKTFAYFLDDHHGDGRVALCCKATPWDQEMLLEIGPERFSRPAYLGRHGWISLWLDVPPVNWDQVAGLVTEGYQIIAPKRLVARTQ